MKDETVTVQLRESREPRSARIQPEHLASGQLTVRTSRGRFADQSPGQRGASKKSDGTTAQADGRVREQAKGGPKADKNSKHHQLTHFL